MPAKISAIVPLLTQVEGIAFKYGPCAFVSREEYEFCCCEVPENTACWNHESHTQWQDCCENDFKEKCPLGSRVFRRLQPRTEVARAGIQDTLAVYQFGDLRTTVLEILNCEHGVHWATWKMLSLLLQRHKVETLHQTAKLDRKLTALATDIVSSFNLSSLGEQPADTECAFCAYFGHEWLDTVSRFGIKEQTWLKDPRETLCVLGYVSAAFVVALTTKVRSLLPDALRLFAGNQDLDISSSSIWPISYWDLALNLGRGRPRQMRTLAADARAVAKFPELLLYPGPYRRWQAWSQSEAKPFIRAVSLVYHPAVDIEIPSFLLNLSDGRLGVTFAFLDVGSHYTGDRMIEHVCSQWPDLCMEPNAAVVFEEGAAPSADLLFCCIYSHCQRLETWMGHRLPLISYYAGFPENDFYVRSGEKKVEEELKAMWRYVGRREEDAMLLVDAPYTAEVLHAHSGQLHPIYRPLAVYLTRFKYAPKLDQILVPKSRSASVSSQSEWMFHLLVSLAGESFAPKFAIQNSFLGFEDYAAYQAIAYLPGPHSWVLMQWREFYSMDMPLFVPHREDLLAHSRYWHINLWNNLKSVPEENWMQQKEFWSQRHPYRPFPPQVLRACRAGGFTLRLNLISGPASMSVQACTGLKAWNT